IAIVNKLFSEESRLHLSELYATKVARSQLYWTSIGLAVFAGLVGILLAAGGLGGTAINAMGGSEARDLIDFLVAGYNFLPSVLFFTGLAALALGWVPTPGRVGHIHLISSFMLSSFGGISHLPEGCSNLAIQSWIPQMPMEDFDAPVFMTITVISIVLMVIGYLGYSRRDMNEGA